MVVVRCCACRQFCLGDYRRYHPEHYPPGVGLRCRADTRNNCCAVREYPRMAVFTAAVLTLLQSTILYSRFGNGIATNNLSKMLAGLMVPGRPVGNMYFAAWSHNVISNAVSLSNDLKMGEYRMCYFHERLVSYLGLTSPSSENSSACHVPHSMLWHHIGRLH